jgi:hypothetical protein
MTEHAPTAPPDQAAADRLASEFHRCFSDFEAGEGLFADDTLFDLLPPLWRFQIQGPSRAFTAQLRSIAQGPVEVAIARTIPTTTGFLTEHIETQHAPAGVVTARRLHVCEVRDGRITAVTTHRDGPWDEALRTRQAAEAPMIRP